jgi:Carboxypeptidase regulatory-like domain
MRADPRPPMIALRQVLLALAGTLGLFALGACANDSAAKASATPPIAVAGRHVAGHIVRACDGTGLPGVRVTAVRGGDPASSDVPREDEPGDVSADPDGSFALDGVAADCESLCLTRGDPAVDDVCVAAIPRGTGDVADAVLTFDSGLRLHGEVRDERGRPVPGARVSFVGSDAALTGKDGRFELRDQVVRYGDDVPPCLVHKDGFATAARSVRVSPAAPLVARIDVTLEQGGEIEGRVTDATGRPLGSVRVDALFVRTGGDIRELPADFERRTDAGGGFVMDGLPAGTCVLSVNAGDDRAAAEARVLQVVVRAGATVHADVPLAQGARLSGRVVDTQGAPVAGARVTAELPLRWPAQSAFTGLPRDDNISPWNDVRAGAGDGMAPGVRAPPPAFLAEDERITDAAGRFDFSDLAAGDVHLVVATGGKSLASWTKDAHASAESANDVVITLADLVK